VLKGLLELNLGTEPSVLKDCLEDEIHRCLLLGFIAYLLFKISGFCNSFHLELELPDRYNVFRSIISWNIGDVGCKTSKP